MGHPCQRPLTLCFANPTELGFIRRFLVRFAVFPLQWLAVGHPPVVWRHDHVGKVHPSSGDTTTSGRSTSRVRRLATSSRLPSTISTQRGRLPRCLSSCLYRLIQPPGSFASLRPLRVGGSFSSQAFSALTLIIAAAPLRRQGRSGLASCSTKPEKIENLRVEVRFGPVDRPESPPPSDNLPVAERRGSTMRASPAIFSPVPRKASIGSCMTCGPLPSTCSTRQCRRESGLGSPSARPAIRG